MSITAPPRHHTASLTRGCTGARTRDASTPTSVATGPIDGTGKKLRFFTYEAVQTVDMVKAVLADYDKKYGSTTTVDNLPGSGAAVYPDKLRTELLGGSGPDVWRIWGGQIGAPYAKAKQSLDLSAYAKKYGWGDKVNAQALKAMNFYGMQAGAPYLMRGLGGWYNKAVLTKAGVSQVRLARDAPLRVPAGGDRRTGAARQVARRLRILGSKGSDRRVRSVQEVAGQEVAAERRARPRSRRH
jgi:maltose-binding protein MalE